MEIMVAYWWLVKLVVMLFFWFTVYKMFKTKFKSKFWIIIFIAAFTLALITPIKIGVNTTQVQKMSDHSIENLRKNVPKAIHDNSFNESTKLRGIEEKDLK